MIVNYACRSLDNLLDRAKTNALTGVFPALGRLDPVVIAGANNRDSAL